MTEPNAKFVRLRALAAELLRAQRDNDKTGFDKATLQAEGDVPALLVSLCGIANKAMDRVIGRDKAEALVAELAAQMKDPPRRDLYTNELWSDAITLLEAVGNDDGSSASSIMNGVPDLLALHGFTTQAMAEILVNIPAETRAGWFAQLRAMPPPSL